MGHVSSVTCHFPLRIFPPNYTQRSIKNDHSKNYICKKEFDDMTITTLRQMPHTEIDDFFLYKDFI